MTCAAGLNGAARATFSLAELHAGVVLVLAEAIFLGIRMASKAALLGWNFRAGSVSLDTFRDGSVSLDTIELSDAIVSFESSSSKLTTFGGAELLSCC